MEMAPKRPESLLRQWGPPALRVVGTIAATVVVTFLMMWNTLFAQMPVLPDKESLWTLNREPAVEFIDAKGQTIAVRGPRYGRAVTLEGLPKHVVDAFIGAEDKRFREHTGVDMWAIVRAMLANLQAGRTVEGASTITQQLVKNLFLTPDQTLKRKAQEARLAGDLERMLSKDEILETLSQPHLSRRRRLWTGCGRAHLLRQGAEGPVAGRGRDARLLPQGAFALRPAGADVQGQGSPGLRARPDGRGGHDHTGAGRRGEGADAGVRQGPARQLQWSCARLCYRACARDHGQSAARHGDQAVARPDAAGGGPEGGGERPGDDGQGSQGLRRRRARHRQRDWRDPRHGRRTGLSEVAVQPRNSGAPPAGLVVQDVRLRRSPRRRDDAGNSALRHAGDDQELASTQLWRRIHGRGDAVPMRWRNRSTRWPRRSATRSASRR
jgi:hypothetical protein